ncbi:hypothetical protein [Actinacidiphila oryziradicis]|uniref:HNH endonuclease n=1 Tax=Actinacidiphila oryziradicis TaxID=2571141 RepID=A0A4U0SLV3_9ACTN|nr:hypothetical protein [Actinacidiphila oryziradicis]TKA10864.1 hypothetical protein FCI23_14650 [Actinacidiphila oryziradicis]
MATFDSSEQTHPAVLPQRRALEPQGADNPESRGETALRLRQAVFGGAGVEHGRGETRAFRPRSKKYFGYQTGDLVRAVVPTGKGSGTHVGRVCVRVTGSFDITTSSGRMAGINHRDIRLLQRGGGYGYTARTEAQGVSG